MYTRGPEAPRDAQRRHETLQDETRRDETPRDGRRETPRDENDVQKASKTPLGVPKDALLEPGRVPETPPKDPPKGARFQKTSPRDAPRRDETLQDETRRDETPQNGRRETPRDEKLTILDET